MIDRYEIVSQLGEDLLGAVYLADDTMLQRRVMFRHIEQADRKVVESRSDSWRKDFSKFAGKLCNMQHPNLLTIYDISTEDDGAFVVTQYIEGDSLAERLEKGALGQVGVHRMAADMLEALHAAHQSGVYHGALHTASVSRVHRAAGGHRYLLVDLGLNQLVSMVKGEQVSVADPVLLAPELHDRDVEPDARADLFMLGQLCYTALVGGHPFSGMDADECVAAYQSKGMPPLSDYVENVDPGFAEWVMRLVSHDPLARPMDTAEAMVSLHTITLDEVAPNVPGETHAVELAEMPQLRASTGPVAATPATPVSTFGNPTPQRQPANSAVHAAAANSAAKAQGLGLGLGTSAQSAGALHQDIVAEAKKKTLKLTLSGILAVLVVGGLFIMLNQRQSEQQASSDAAESEALPSVQISQAMMVNTNAEREDPVVVNLDTANSLDWLVTTTLPSPENYTSKIDGSYIQSFQLSDVKSEYRYTQPSVNFKSGGKKLLPRAATGNHTGSKPGAGYELLLRIPAEATESFTANLYFLQRYCDVRVEIDTPESESAEVKLIPATDAGVLCLPIEINHPKPGDFYTIRLLSTSSSVSGAFSIGLCGVSIESKE